jgi:hypothetical protein
MRPTTIPPSQLLNRVRPPVKGSLLSVYAFSSAFTLAGSSVGSLELLVVLSYQRCCMHYYLNTPVELLHQSN